MQVPRDHRAPRHNNGRYLKIEGIIFFAFGLIDDEYAIRSVLIGASRINGFGIAVNRFPLVRADLQPQRRPVRVTQRQQIGIINALFEHSAVLLRHNRGDHINKLRQTTRFYAIGIVDERADHAAERDRIGKVVHHFQTARPDRPFFFVDIVMHVGIAHGGLGVPHVPLVERKLHAFFTALIGADVIGRRRNRLDKRVEIGMRTHEIPLVARRRVSIITVQRQIIDVFIGMLQYHSVPLGIGFQIGRGRTAHDQTDIFIDPFHHFCGFGRFAPVFFGSQRANLPVAVHFVADTPRFNAERLFPSVCPTHIGKLRPLFDVAIFDEFGGVFGRARAEIDAHHDVGARFGCPVVKLMQPDVIGFQLPPGKIELYGAVFSYAVTPVVSRKEIPARITDQGNAQFFHRRQHVLAEPLFVCAHVRRFIDPAVNRPPHMFDETAPQFGLDRADGIFLVDDDFLFHDSTVLLNVYVERSIFIFNAQ